MSSTVLFFVFTSLQYMHISPYIFSALKTLQIQEIIWNQGLSDLSSYLLSNLSGPSYPSHLHNTKASHYVVARLCLEGLNILLRATHRVSTRYRKASDFWFTGNSFSFLHFLSLYNKILPNRQKRGQVEVHGYGLHTLKTLRFDNCYSAFHSHLLEKCKTFFSLVQNSHR